MAFRNAFWQIIYITTIIFISLIPLIGWITPLLAIIVECYYYGFSMLDYSCERKEMNPSKSVDFISTHKGLAIGNGIVFYLMHLIPVIGWVFAPAYAVIAATISMHEVEE
jgi:CysZ protein